MSNNKGKCPSETQRMSLSFTGKETYMWNFLRDQFSSQYYIKALIHEDMLRRNLITEKDNYNK